MQCNEKIAENNAVIFHYLQSPKMSPQEYADDIIVKPFKVEDMNDEISRDDAFTRPSDISCATTEQKF